MVHIRPQRHVSNKQIFADGHPTVSNLKLAAQTEIPGQFSGTNQNSQRYSWFPLNLPLLLLPRHSLPRSTQPPIRLFCTDLQQSLGSLLTTARRFSCRTASFHQLPNTKRPRTRLEPRLSASHKAFRIIRLLPRLANEHTSNMISKCNSQETNCRALFLPHVIHSLNGIKEKFIFVLIRYCRKSLSQRFPQAKHMFWVYQGELCHS